MTKIISIINHKGGVGKTTTTANIGACLAKSDKKTLLLDLDPQGNLSQHFDILAPDAQLADSLIESKIIQPFKIEPNLYIAPSDLKLMDAERDLIQSRLAFGRLRKILSMTLEKYDFDYILIDCPPSLGILTENALTSSDEVLIPIEPTAFAYNGLHRIFDLIEDIREEMGASLSVKGVILTMVDIRTSVQKHIQEEIAELLNGQHIYKNSISRAIAFQESAVEGKHIFDYAPNSKAAHEYKSLTEEIFNV